MKKVLHGKNFTKNKFLKHKKLLGKIQKSCMIRADIINNKNKNKNSEADVFGKYEDLEAEPSFDKREQDTRRKKQPDAKNQEGQGLKILTPDKMPSRLPITLVQLQVRNNSEKF